MILTLLTTLLIIDALVLIFLIIALQQGNEGGLGGAFGGGNSAGFFGATGGVKLIVQATWVCGILFFVLAMSTSWLKTHNKYDIKNQLEKSLVTPSASVSTTPPAQSFPNQSNVDPLAQSLPEQSVADPVAKTVPDQAPKKAPVTPAK